MLLSMILIGQMLQPPPVKNPVKKQVRLIGLIPEKCVPYFFTVIITFHRYTDSNLENFLAN